MTSSSITVIGADDPLGEAVMREALVRGLSVHATARRPEQLPTLSRALRVVEARPSAQHELGPAISGSGAVVLGLSPQLDAEPTMRVTDAAIATARAMREAGVQRLAAASSLDLAGPSTVPSALRSLLGPVHDRLHHGGLQDLRRLERLLAGSGLDWTVLRTGTLVDLLGTKQQRVVPLARGASRTLARDDLARALVDQALRPGGEPRVAAVTA